MLRSRQSVFDSITQQVIKIPRGNHENIHAKMKIKWKQIPVEVYGMWIPLREGCKQVKIAQHAAQKKYRIKALLCFELTAY